VATFDFIAFFDAGILLQVILKYSILLPFLSFHQQGTAMEAHDLVGGR
jgi:hypothetical protein